jgi:hypothetical protein
MFKMKLLMGLAAVVAALVVSAAPAGAWFEANSATTHGKIKSFPTESTFTAESGSIAVTCKSASGEPAGEWEIQVKEENAEGFQQQTKVGPHEQLKISKWGHCETNLLSVSVKCSLQVIQETKGSGEQKATGNPYAPGCSVLAGTEAGNHCLIKIADETANKGLSEVKLENIGTNEVGIIGNITGISFTSTEVGEVCKTLHIGSSGKTAMFKTNGGKLITEGQKLV